MFSSRADHNSYSTIPSRALLPFSVLPIVVLRGTAVHSCKHSTAGGSTQDSTPSFTLKKAYAACVNRFFPASYPTRNH